MDTRSKAIFGLWILSVIGGIGAMVRYQVTPGAAATPPKTLPTAEAQPRVNKARADIRMFLHPQCPCTRATVSEMARIVARYPDSLQITVYFYKPRTEQDSWCRATGLWDAAGEIKGARLLVDTDGVEAKKFGAKCSGQVLAYDPTTQKLVFSGGITSGRGHEGPSGGGDALLELARSGNCPIATTQVFGCAIYTTEDPGK